MSLLHATDFNLNRFNQISNLANAIAKVHEAYNAYLIAEAHTYETDYQRDYYEWEQALDNRDKVAAKFRSAIRSYAKVVGLEQIRSRYEGRVLNGHQSAYAWAKAFNDTLSEYSEFYRLSWETLDLLKMVRKATDCDIYLNCD